MHTKAKLSFAAAVLATVSSAHAFMDQDLELNALEVTEISSGATEDSTSLTSIFKRADGTDTTSPDPDFLPGISAGPNGGSWFGEVRFGFTDGTNFFIVQGDRVKWNDGVQTGPFVSGSRHSVDVFFDDLGFYGTNDGFFYQPTLLDDTNSVATSGGGFGVRVVDTTGAGDLAWRVVADGDEKGFSFGSGGPSFFDIDTTGWYTMETVWEDDGSGNIDRTDTLYDAAGTSVFSLTETGVAALADVGSLGAASFGNGDADGTLSQSSAAAIDNLIAVVPEPSAFALLFGLSALGLSVTRRRR